MFKTRITELLGVKYPIIGGAMAYLSGGRLAAAVSNAGGFGLISAVTFSREELQNEIQLCRSLTKKPFGVNIALIHRDPRKIEQDMDVVIEDKCAAVRHAQTAERIGVDAVTLVGYDAAGHTGLDDLPLSIMIPLAVDSVKIPVIAAGGVGDGRGFVAALALGASGVQIGTRFIASKECPACDTFKNWLIQTEATDTVHIERSMNRAYRVRRNEATQKVLELEKQGCNIFDILPYIGGEALQKVIFEGDVNAGVVACGPVAGLINDIPSVKQIIDRMVKQGQGIVERLNAS
jgi:NAD(P)H-dependent flavin oxidoreductase YrpB (nitropropane dioxygenase family)